MVILASRGSRSQKFERGKSHDTNYRHRSVSRKMATDYDAPRKTDDEMSEDSLEELKARRQEKSSPIVDEDETEAAEGRSEEHTSELQSRGHLVCRLLLEKTNNNK